MKSWRVLNGTFETDEKMAFTYTHDLYFRTKHKVSVAWNHIHCQEGLGDLSKELINNTVPGLFIHGELDPLIPVQSAIDTAKVTAHSELIIIPGMGHMFFNRSLEDQIEKYLIRHF